MHKDVLPPLDLVRLLDERQGGQALQEDGRGVAGRDVRLQLDGLVRVCERILGKGASGGVRLCGDLSQ